MVEFLKLQYKMGKVTEAQLEHLVANNRITAEEKNLIMQGG